MAKLTKVFQGRDGKGQEDFYTGGGWSGADGESGSIYKTVGSPQESASRWRFSLKENELVEEPTIWLNKRTKVSRSDGIKRWDAGNLYCGLDKIEGDAYAASLTGAARHLGGEGDVIGVHGRGYAYHGKAKVWGGWFYAASRVDSEVVAGEAPIDMIGVEINLNHKREDISWTPAEGKGLYRGLVVTTADGGKRCHIGIDVGAQTSNKSDPWYVGLRIRKDSIVPFNDEREGNAASAILIEGSTLQSKAYGGLSFKNGTLAYGIDFTGIALIDNQAALVMKDDHRIRWGSRVSSRYISGNSVTGQVNFNNYAIAVNGNKVIGKQQQAISNASQGTEVDTINNILEALRSHGLIKRG